MRCHETGRRETGDHPAAAAAEVPRRAAGGWATIPPRVIRKAGFAFSASVFNPRCLVERVCNSIKHFRGPATRCDRSPDNVLAAPDLAAIRLWLAEKCDSVTGRAPMAAVAS